MLSGSPVQLILFFGTMVLATAFFNQLGYPLTSFLLLVVLLRTLGMKRWTFNISFIFYDGSRFLFSYLSNGLRFRCQRDGLDSRKDKVEARG